MPLGIVKVIMMANAPNNMKYQGPKSARNPRNNKNGIAARIAHHKTGLVASLDKLNAVNLSTLVGEVLSDATYRDNARRIQKAIVKANGLSVAADLVEESLGMTEGRQGVRQVARIGN